MQNTIKCSILPTVVCAIFTTLSVHAQSAAGKLEPTQIIGTALSVDYNNYNATSTTVNTIAEAFDGDSQTFFAAYDHSGGWVGLDLGEKHVITQVAYCPRAFSGSSLVLGVFEGANHPDFGDAVPLSLIPDAPSEQGMTVQTVACTRGFRYVRYIGPNNARCQIAELAFYGYPGEGDDSGISSLTNLPAVVIHTKYAQDIVEKEVYLSGIVSFIPADGKEIYTDSLDIRGRGNASWHFPKKPYRLKLRNKAHILGNPAKEKNWTLINNYGDKTLMRNLLAFDLSQRLEMPYTPAGQPVNLFLNGEYKGCYQLCDQIEVADQRVELTKMKTSDITGDNLTGGYLIEIDAYAYQELPTSVFTSFRYNIPVTIKYPKDDEIVPEQKTYIQQHFESFVTALLSSSYTDPESGYRKYLDTNTFIRHFLVGELSGNTDTYWSVYMYKDRMSDQFLTGPVWDFDIAYDNDNRTYPVNNISDWLFASGKSSCAGNARGMVNRLLTDPAFLSELKATYAHYRDSQVLSEEALLAVVDHYASRLDQSQRLNFTRWKIMDQLVHQNPRIHGSYTAEVENVRQFIRSRIAWMDRKLNYAPTANEKISFCTATVTGYENYMEITGLEQHTRIAVYSVLGQTIATRVADSQCSIPVRKGIYLVRLTNGHEGERTLKCMVH